MEIVPVKTVCELIDYKRAISLVTNKLIHVPTEFIKEKINIIFLEELYDYEIDPSTTLMVESMLDILTDRISESIDIVCEETRHNLNIDVLENQMSDIIMYINSSIHNDIVFKLNILSKIHPDFSMFPNIRLNKNYTAYLKHNIRI